MAAIEITAANVLAGSNASKVTGVAGATITAGQAVYADSGDSDEIKLADCDLSAAAAATVGIALHGATAGQPITYQVGGLLTMGATLVAGDVYVLGSTAGAIHLIDDVTTGWRISILGVATTTAVLDVSIKNYASIVHV